LGTGARQEEQRADGQDEHYGDTSDSHAHVSLPLNGPWRYCLRPNEVTMTLQRVAGAALAFAGEAARQRANQGFY
jgi:hypothetical protein